MMVVATIIQTMASQTDWSKMGVMMKKLSELRFLENDAVDSLDALQVSNIDPDIINVRQLPNLIHITNDGIAVPTIKFPSIFIPFDTEEHDFHFVRGVKIADLISVLLNKKLHSKKLLFLPLQDPPVLFEFPVFTHGIISCLIQSSDNDPMIITDAQLSLVACFQVDLRVTFITEKDQRKLLLGGYDKTYWDKYFMENMEKNLSNEYHRSLIKEKFIERFIETEL